MTHFECKCFGDVLMIYPVIRFPKNGWRFLYCPNMCVGPTLHRCSLGELGVEHPKRQVRENASRFGHQFRFFSLCDWYLLIVFLGRQDLMSSESWFRFPISPNKKHSWKHSVVTSILQEMKDVYWCLWLFVTSGGTCFGAGYSLLAHPCGQMVPRRQEEVGPRSHFFWCVQCLNNLNMFERLEKGWIKNKKKDTHFLRFLRFW